MIGIRKNVIIFLIICVALMSGCATTPVQVGKQDAQKLPRDEAKAHEDLIIAGLLNEEVTWALQLLWSGRQPGWSSRRQTTCDGELAV